MEKPLLITKVNDIPNPNVIIVMYIGFKHNKIILLNKIDSHINPEPLTSLNNKNPK